jgi:hypothetical protein
MFERVAGDRICLLRVAAQEMAAAKKKGTPTLGRFTDPRQGATKQHKADAPLRGRGTSTAFVEYKSLAAQVGGFCESSS